MAIPITRKEQAVRNLVTLWQGITVANGFFQTAKLVERGCRNFDNVSDQYPYIGLDELLDGEIEEFGSLVTHHRDRMRVVTYIDKASSGDIGSATTQGREVMNAWLKCLLVRLESDRDLGGMAIDCKPIGFGPSNNSHHFDNGLWVRTAELYLVLEYEANRLSLTD